MQLLPAIPFGAAHVRLPLADSTAVRLANVLFTAETGQRLRLLAETLAEDPPLALWIVAQAWTRHCEQLQTFSQLAEWMTPERWNSLGESLQSEVAPDESQQTLWPELMSASLHALPPETLDSPQALAAMLHNARAWLAASGASMEANETEVDAVLPPWLIAQRVELVEDDGDSRVREIVDRWSNPIAQAAELLAKAIHFAVASDQAQRADDEYRLREKLASLKEFAYGASHELNNPLFNISSRAQVLLRDETDPQRRKKLATIYSHAMRASEMINDVALAARPPAPQFAVVDAAEIARNVIEELQPHATGQGALLTLAILEDSIFEHVQAGRETCPTTVEADATQLAIVIREMCINAIEAIGRSDRAGRVRVGLSGDQESLEIVVQDDGPGLDERSRRHLFDPFFSGYEAGRGLGFGLTKCWQIVQAHHGRIFVHSPSGRGTTLTVVLPRRQAVP